DRSLAEPRQEIARQTPPAAGPEPPVEDRVGDAATPALPQADAVERVRAEVKALKQESLDLGHRLMEDYPDGADGPNLLGAIHYRCGEAAKAWQYWEQAWTRDPSRADACSGMASIAS